MASASTKIATTILKPVTTFEGHEGRITSISYFLDGQRIISGSLDKTTRQWDLKAGKEIEGAKEVFEKRVCAVAVSRDGRWIVTADGDWNGGRLKACEVETGIVKIFEGHSQYINTVDISTDSTLLASGSEDETSRIWNLKTGKLVAGPFKSVGPVGAVRFSSDSKKLAVELGYGTCLEVWDIQSQKLDIRLGKSDNGGTGCAPVFWTNENKNIVAAFEFNSESDSESDLDDVTSSTDSDRYYSSVAKTIYEFDASTLETIGAPFQGHTDIIWGLALSFDGALLASSSYHDYTIKLWAFESRQLLASFHVHNPITLILSSDSRQLVYTIDTEDDRNICICDIPPEILAQARITPRKKSARRDLLNSDATRRRPAGHHRPPISAIPITPRPSSTRDPQQPTFLRLRGLLRFSSRTNAVPVRHIQPRDPLDFSATSPLPYSLSGQVATRFDHLEISSPPSRSNGVVQSLRQHLSFLVPRHSHGSPVTEVAPRRDARLLAAKLPEYRKADDTRHPSSQQATMPQEHDTAEVDSLPDVHWCKAFLCYYSCWSHGRLRMPPRWRLERVDISRQDGTVNNSRSGGPGHV